MFSNLEEQKLVKNFYVTVGSINKGKIMTDQEDVFTFLPDMELISRIYRKTYKEEKEKNEASHIETFHVREKI